MPSLVNDRDRYDNASFPILYQSEHEKLLTYDGDTMNIVTRESHIRFDWSIVVRLGYESYTL